MSDEEFCCDEFKRASQPGTDGEGYGSAVHKTKGRDGIYRWYAGESDPFKLCPWCGEEILAKKYGGDA